MMHLEVRRETPADYRAVEALTYHAFLPVELPGRTQCDEHFLAHIMRDVPGFVPELDFVAQEGSRLVGSILYTKSIVISTAGARHVMLTFGPLSVLPEAQGKGVGAALVQHSITEAKRLGYRGIFIFGHPAYYARFGFRNAQEFCITTPEGENFDAFMALPLYAGALDGIAGKLYCDPVYEINPAAFAAFEREFQAELLSR